MKLKLITTAFFLFFLANVYGQGYWTAKASFSSGGRDFAQGFSIGTKGYVGMGYVYHYITFSSYKDFWEWDQATNTWSQKASFPGLIRGYASGFSIGAKGYFANGADSAGNNVQELWEWNQPTNIWTRKTDFPGTSGGNSVAFATNGKAYVFGNYPNNDFWEYDPATDTWTRQTDFAGISRGLGAGFAIGNKGYIGTGWGGGYLNDFWEYDPATDTWTRKADFGGQGRYETSGFATCNYGYIGLGTTLVAYGATKDFWRYDPATDTWTPVADFGAGIREGAVGFSIGNRGYISTGYENDSYSTVTKDLWELTDPDVVCANSLAGSFAPSDTTFCGEGQRCIDFFDLSSGNPTSWQWLFPGAVPSNSSLQNPTHICYNQNGIYDVTLIVSNSFGTDTITIPSMVKFSAGPLPPVVSLHGDTLVSSTASHYQWFINAAPIAGATDSFYVAQLPGTYAVQIADSLGCISVSDGVVITSVNELTVSEIKIFPNPVSSSLLLQFNSQSKDAEVIIYNTLGKEVLRKKMDGERMEIERSSFESGIYFVRIESEDRQWIQKIIIE